MKQVRCAIIYIEICAILHLLTVMFIVLTHYCHSIFHTNDGTISFSSGRKRYRCSHLNANTTE